MSNVREYDPVALLEDVATLHYDTGARITLPRGSVGTVVMEHNEGAAYEVEFSDDQGRAYAILPLRPEQLLVLHYKTAAQAA
jgi:hypothetical protein